MLKPSWLHFRLFQIGRACSIVGLGNIGIVSVPVLPGTVIGQVSRVRGKKKQINVQYAEYSIRSSPYPPPVACLALGSLASQIGAPIAEAAELESCTE